MKEGCKRARIEQAWFPGCHSDVGGSHADAGLSDIALKCMLEKARDRGLLLKEDWQDSQNPDPSGRVHESRRACGCYGLRRHAASPNRPRFMPASSAAWRIPPTTTAPQPADPIPQGGAVTAAGVWGDLSRGNGGTAEVSRRCGSSNPVYAVGELWFSTRQGPSPTGRSHRHREAQGEGS